MTDRSVIIMKKARSNQSDKPRRKKAGGARAPGASGGVRAVVKTKAAKASASAKGATVKKNFGTREARSAARRETILAAALDEFSARGFEGARLDDVAKRAGVAKGTIYLYFRDKETLFQELVRAMLAPVIEGIEAMDTADVPASVLGERFVELFVTQVYETRRQDIIRLMISEGRRFPKLAEFYYREVLSRVIETVRVMLKRAAERGDVPEALVEFPQLIAASGLVGIIWGGLFDRYAPLDVRKMMTAHAELLFAPRRAS